MFSKSPFATVAIAHSIQTSRFAFALYFALMMDVLNALAPTGPITRQVLDGMSWPPFFMRDLFE